MGYVHYAGERRSLEEILPVRQWGDDQPAVVALVLVSVHEYGQHLHEEYESRIISWLQFWFKFLTSI